MLKQFKRFLLIKTGVCKPSAHPGDVWVDWTEAEAYNDEHDLLYRG